MAYMGFDDLKRRLAARTGAAAVRNPAAVAASIGRRKYGAKRFNAAARSGRKLGRKRPRSA